MLFFKLCLNKCKKGIIYISCTVFKMLQYICKHTNYVTYKKEN